MGLGSMASSVIGLYEQFIYRAAQRPVTVCALTVAWQEKSHPCA